MPQTQEDIQLLQRLSSKVDQFRQLILRGRPYVWELRLSLEEFNVLESSIRNSISSHEGNHSHLLSKDFAPIVVIYLAEWYKRFYEGTNTIDENKVLSLNTEELKNLYELAKIDKNTFVYSTSMTNRWQESLQVLGGLAVRAELNRDRNDRLLSSLCKMFHGNEVDFDIFTDNDRAVAFRESIVRQHSLYEYLKCILEKDNHGRRNLPFAPSDIRNEETCIPQFIDKIKDADWVAKKHKFDFEWVINYTASRNQMVRHLRVKLRPEEIGGGKKQYIGYDRLRRSEWGVEHPEDVGRISFYLRFKNGRRYIQKEGENEEPLFKYHNTGSEVTGFLAVNTTDESIYTNVPVEQFDKVEIVMKYDNSEKVVQELDVRDYIQVYGVSKNPHKFTDHTNTQAVTILIFSTAYHLTEEYKDLPVEYARFRNGDQVSEEYCCCPINDKVIIADGENKEILPPFYNRNGLYQVVTKKYLKTIKYKENLFVLYEYKDTDCDEDEREMQYDDLAVMFGRTGLEVRHFSSKQASDYELVTGYTLEWLSDKRYVNWNIEAPQQGEIKLRITVNGIEFKLRVYYVPFTPTADIAEPIWRDFKNMRICTALDGVGNIQDDFEQSLLKKQPDTTPLKIGTDDAKILIEVYRPVILRELSQKKTGDEESRVVKYYQGDEDIHIPLINCEQFSVRDFSKNGVKEYSVKKSDSLYYRFSTFNQINLKSDVYTEEHSAKELLPEISLDYLKIYITKAMDNQSEQLYAWDYKSPPKAIENPNEMQGEGVVFQSLIKDDSPRDYKMPIIKKKSGWGGKKDSIEIDLLDCFETVAEHKTYFFLFNPLIKVVASQLQIPNIILPLIKKRNYQLTENDIDNLYKFAVHFHFDWMLLPRLHWDCGINNFSKSDDDRSRLKAAIEDFFYRTPKCSDKSERMNLKSFLSLYWTFDKYPNIHEVPKNAVKLILDDPEALKGQSMEDFLKIYDDCRFKFIEMSKVLTNGKNDNAEV